MAADFSGLELIYGFSRAIHREGFIFLFFFIFNSYLTIPFGISSRGNPEGNQSDLQDEIGLAYLFKRNRSVIRRYWILG